MSDPRLPDILSAAKSLPDNSAIIYRHFGAANAEKTAHKLRQICFEKNHQLLIGKDTKLAIDVGADGVHFPQSDMNAAKLWRRRCPDWILTTAAHDNQSIARASTLPLNAVTLSPIFESQSPSADVVLGVASFNALTSKSKHPIFALGGINAQTAAQLIGSHAAGIAGVSGI